MQNAQRDFGGLSAKEVNKRRYRLCADHFEKNQFLDESVDQQSKRPKLRYDAVPTLFPSQVTMHFDTYFTVKKLYRRAL